MGFLVDYVPGFSIFRSAQYKFIPALYFSYALLISYTINFLAARLKPYKQALIAFGVVILVLSYHFPYFTPNFFIWAKPLTLSLKIPEYVTQFKSWSDAHLSSDERLFIVPRLNSIWKTEVYTWNFFAPYSLINLVTDKPVLENVAAMNPIEMSYVDRLYQELLAGNTFSAAQLASLLQTQYVLYRGDANYTLDWLPSENPKNFLTAIERLPGTKRVWSSGLWSVYHLPPDKKFSGRIFGLDALTKYIGNDTDMVGALMGDSNNMVREADLATPYLSDASPRIPVPGMISAAPCASCVLEGKITDPVMPAVRLLPGSFFYFIKSWRERNLENPALSPRELAGNRLGLSLTRSLELKKLIDQDENLDAIHETADTLTRYWNEIDPSLDLSGRTFIDFRYLETIRNYVTYEEALFSGIYNNNGSVRDEHQPYVHKELSRILETLHPISQRIHEFLSGTEWTDEKVYQVPQGMARAQLYLDAGTLGHPMRVPSSLEIDGRPYAIKPVVSGNKIMLGTFDVSDASALTVLFSAPTNRIGQIRTDIENYPVLGQQCAAADIQNFDWQQKYEITLKTEEITKGIRMFLKKQNVVTRQDPSSLSGYTAPSDAFDLESQKNERVKRYYFDGSDGDTGATLYICSVGSEDVVGLMKQVSVEERIQPSVYFIPEAQSKISSPLTELTYTRINSTKYLIHTTGRWPNIVVFNERFNPGWRLYSAGLMKYQPMPWTKAFWVDDQTYDSHHFRIYGFANAWYVDSTATGDMVLEYYPQILYYRGIVVSVGGIILLAIVLALQINKHKHHE